MSMCKHSEWHIGRCIYMNMYRYADSFSLLQVFKQTCWYLYIITGKHTYRMICLQDYLSVCSYDYRFIYRQVDNI